jgi:hypothetical protein
MKLSFLNSSLAALLLSVAAFAAKPPVSPQIPFKIMLQGSSAAEMRELVTLNGGMVTHDLPIINAVGARVTRQCLDNILESPLVDRYLDDLSASEIPKPAPAEPEPGCDVGGALELGINDTGINWRLYNKNEQPAQLSRLELSWPVDLGALAELRLGKTVLALPSNPVPANQLVLTYDLGTHPEIATTADLVANFSPLGPDKNHATPRQREFTLEVQFVGDCSAKLIPGYANNDEDTYFPTAVGADALHKHGVTGKGITVAIIDSGLWEHEALVNDTQGRNRLIARYDAITDISGKTTFDESGHGTHIASVLAHSGQVTFNAEPTGSFKGVAPDVNLVAVKAFDIEGHGDFLDLVRAIQFVVDNRDKYGIKVLNLSFAARPRWIYWLDPINQAIMRAWAAGITVVAAAGNEGPDAMTIGSPGNLPYVITVGAVTDSWTLDTRDDDYIPDFSSRGPTPDAHLKPDLVAPGGHMTGLTRPGSTLTKEHPEYFLGSGEFVMTGSSQASALVSGVAALLLQLEPDLSPDDVKCKLMSSAEVAINADGLLAYNPFQQGSGYVSATRAITLGQRGCGNVGLDIQKEIDGKEHFQGPAIVNEDGSTSLPGLGDMLSPEEPATGTSSTRKWGVKEHIERPDYEWKGQSNEPSATSPFDWESAYLQEKARIEGLAEEPSSTDSPP